MKQNCYYCGKAKYKPIFLPKVSKEPVFFKCLNCKLISLEKEKRPQDRKEYYSSVYYPESYDGKKDMMSTFLYRLPVIEKYLPKGAKIIENGAASGDFLSLLQNIGYAVNGVEISSRAAMKAREHYGFSLFCGTLKEANFTDNTFDGLVMYHVLEHVDDPISLLKEVFRILKPGGIIIVEVPNPRSIDGAFSKRLLKSILDYPNHTYAFPPNVLRGLMEKAGFLPIYEEKSFPFLVSSFILGLKRYVQGTPSKKEPSRDSAEDTLLRTRADSTNFLKRIFSKVFPGMKITIVAKKPDII